jgi:NAD(P)-dependent dehydrogenase (short-subunit alcohol dehydrogenase family)
MLLDTGLVPMRFRGAYNASKHALEGLSVTLALELEGSGIHVSLIEPGAIDTRFRANALPHFYRHIDIGIGVSRSSTRRSCAVSNRPRAQTTQARPEAVHKVLRHALTHRDRAIITRSHGGQAGNNCQAAVAGAAVYPWLASQD